MDFSGLLFFFSIAYFYFSFKRRKNFLGRKIGLLIFVWQETKLFGEIILTQISAMRWRIQETSSVLSKLLFSEKYSSVIAAPAGIQQAGIQKVNKKIWIPASAGMTTRLQTRPLPPKLSNG